MRYAGAEAAARPQHAPRLRHGGRHVVDVDQAVARHDQVEARVAERERGGVTDDVRPGRVRIASRLDEGRRNVETRDLVPAGAKVACDTAFAAADLEHRGRRRGQQLEERAPIRPVCVVPFGPREADPVCGAVLESS